MHLENDAAIDAGLMRSSDYIQLLHWLLKRRMKGFSQFLSFQINLAACSAKTFW